MIKYQLCYHDISKAALMLHSISNLRAYFALYGIASFHRIWSKRIRKKLWRMVKYIKRVRVKTQMGLGGGCLHLSEAMKQY